MNKVYDNTSHGLHSELCNALASVPARIGSTCAEFSGGQYITLPRLAMLEERTTVNFWAYMNNWSDFGTEETTGMRLVSGWESGGWGISAKDGGYIHCGAYDKGVGYKDCTHSKKWNELSSGWHMFTIVFDGQNLYLYVDTEVIGISTAFLSKRIGYNANNRIFIGAEAGGSTTPAGSYFVGKIDDFKIFASALTSEEIIEEYKTRGHISNLGQLFVSWIDEVGYNKLTTNTDGTVKGTSDTVEGYLYPQPDVKLIGSHIYYASIFGYSNYGFRTVDFYWPVTATGYRGQLDASPINTWNLFSWRFTGSSGSGGTISDGVYGVRFDYNHEGSTVAEMQFRNAKLIDLTEIYGAGNEPTKDECDSIFNKSNQIVDRSGVCKPANNICEMGRLLRNLRITMNGSNENSACHICNLSYTTVDGSTVKLMDALVSDQLLDGNLIGGGTLTRYNNNIYFDVSNTIEIDLLDAYNVAYIHMTRYYPDNRYYYGTKIEGSVDGVNYFTIWDSGNTGSYGNDVTYNTYTETAQGRNFIVECEEAQITEDGTIIASQFIEI